MRLMRRAAIAGCLLLAAFIAIHFPYATDAPLTQAEIARSTAFYQQAYAAPAEAPAPDEDQYIQAATAAAEGWHIKDRLTEFAAAQRLANKRVLEVGAGRGYLQDVVADYTGLDISPSVKRFYHKPFILGSATALPFQDNSYDALWSIWVIEHVPNPEQAFREMRRVVLHDRARQVHDVEVLPVEHDLPARDAGRVHQLVDERDVGLVRGLDLRLPRREQGVVADDGRRDHELRVAFVHVTLTQLRVCEARAMADQLMGERPADALDQQRIVRMLEH